MHRQQQILATGRLLLTRSSSASTQRTSLYDFHVAREARMVPFAGYSMPLLYGRRGIIETTHQVRQQAGLFDVSHMLQVLVQGPDAISFIERLTVADLLAMPDNSGALSSYLLEETGGILDDTIVNRCREDHLYIVSNAGCADKIKAHLRESSGKLKARVSIDFLDKTLLALQGPKAAHVLQSGLGVDLAKLQFMRTMTVDSLFGLKSSDQTEFQCIRVTRCGYTGEDGFEISLPNSMAVPLAESLLKNPSVELIGLGARDVLRLEAGMCLYGNDIDESTSPAEAALLWTISKERRKREPAFPGRRHVIEVKPTRKRVGLKWAPGGPQARQGTPVLDPNSLECIGKVTSGCLSPTLNQLIAMAYVPVQLAKNGQTLLVQVRGKNYPAQVVPMPFVPNKFYKPTQ